MFNFDQLPEQKLEMKKGKFIRPGVQNLTLKDIFLESSQNTGNQRPVFFMETDPITDEGWEGFEGAKGQIGKVAGNFGFYLKNEDQKVEFVSFLKSVMMAAGTYDGFKEQHGSTNFSNINEIIDAAKPFLLGTRARYFVAGEQYHKLNNTGIGLKLKFPTRRGVEPVDGESKLPKFDENNTNHFKKIDKDEVMKSKEPVDDLPF